MLQATGQFDRFIRIPAILDPVGRRYPHEQRQLLRPYLTHGLRHLQYKTDTVFKRAAVLILALIAERRQELMQQIAVGSMQLHHLEIRRQCPPRCSNERLDDLIDLCLVQLGRRGVLGIESDLGRAHGHPPTFCRRDAATFAKPWAPSAGLAPGVRDLNGRYRALRRDEAGDSLQGLDLAIMPKAKILRGDTAVFGHGNGFGKDQPGTADGAATQVHQMPVVGQAVLRRVLAHGGDHDTVRQGQLAQGKGLQQLAHGPPLWLSVGCGIARGKDAWHPYPAPIP